MTIIRESFEPAALAASTNSRSLTVITAARTTRAMLGILGMVIAIRRFIILAPRAATIAIANNT